MGSFLARARAVAAASILLLASVAAYAPAWAGMVLPPKLVAQDASGNGYSGAKLNIYEEGTSTPASIYSDAGLTTPLANPVVANSAGVFAPVYAAEGTLFDLELTTSGGSTIWTADSVPAVGADTGAFSRDFVNSRVAISGTGSTVSFEAGPATGDDTGGAARIGGWDGTQADTIQLDAAATTTTGTLTVSGAATFDSTVNTSGTTSFITERSKKLPGVVETPASTFTGASTVEITLPTTPTGVRAWKVVIYDLTRSANAAINMRWSFDGGSTFKSGASDYAYSGYVARNGGGTDIASNAAAQIVVLSTPGGSPDADHPAVLEFTIYTPASGGTARTLMIGDATTFEDATGFTARRLNFGGANLPNYGPVTTVRIYPASGTISGAYQVIPLRGFGE